MENTFGEFVEYLWVNSSPTLEPKMKNNKNHNITPDKCRHPSGAFFLCLILVLGLVGICHAATTSRVLLEDENWLGNVLITGTVMVSENITLNIQPGTTVEFAEGKNTELIVKGELIAEGTDLNPRCSRNSL